MMVVFKSSFTQVKVVKITFGTILPTIQFGFVRSTFYF